jgi:hypothetical protein
LFREGVWLFLERLGFALPLFFSFRLRFFSGLAGLYLAAVRPPSC